MHAASHDNLQCIHALYTTIEIYPMWQPAKFDHLIEHLHQNEHAAFISSITANTIQQR